MVRSCEIGTVTTHFQETHGQPYLLQLTSCNRMHARAWYSILTTIPILTFNQTCRHNTGLMDTVPTHAQPVVHHDRRARNGEQLARPQPAFHLHDRNLLLFYGESVSDQRNYTMLIETYLNTTT